MIQFSCPECGFALEFGDGAAGSAGQCSECGASLVVPGPRRLSADGAEEIVRAAAQKHEAKAILRQLGNPRADHVANARSTFAREMTDGEKPLVLLDDSFLQDGKAGLLLTNRKLYSSKLGPPIFLEDVRDVCFLAPDVTRLALAGVLGVLGVVIPPLLFIAFYLVFSKETRRNARYRLLVGGEDVYAARTAGRFAFWVAVLEALGKAARDARGLRPADWDSRWRLIAVLGRAPAWVECSGCGREYLRRRRPARPKAIEEEFQEDAEPVLSAKEAQALAELRRSADLAPCPDCGWCQQKMISRARRSRHGWLATLALVLVPALLLFVPCGLAPLFVQADAKQKADPTLLAFSVLACLTLLLVAGLPLLKWALSRRWDPNRASPAVRKTLARERSIAREVAVRILGEDLA